MINLAYGNLAELLILEKFSSVVVVTDKHVEKLYLQKLLQLLDCEKTVIISIRPGELSKSRATKAKIETKMLEENCDRDTLLIAFGGGLIGDLGGFVAATYMRGIPYINIPTTLLAMVDSSIGGKVGINVPEGKNLIGTYWQPLKTIIDVNFLLSLPRLHVVNGAIEALKMFLTCDAAATQHFENEINEIILAKPKSLQWLIQRSNEIKSEIVRQDERETELRKILNFGHTLGHAIEKASDYQLLHGIAVGYGILIEARIANLLGYLAIEDYQKIKQFLDKLGLDLNDIRKLSIPNLIEFMKSDKKNHDNKIYCVLLNGVGSVYRKENKVAYPIALSLIEQAISYVLSEG